MSRRGGERGLTHRGRKKLEREGGSCNRIERSLSAHSLLHRVSVCRDIAQHSSAPSKSRNCAAAPRYACIRRPSHTRRIAAYTLRVWRQRMGHDPARTNELQILSSTSRLPAHANGAMDPDEGARHAARRLVEGKAARRAAGLTPISKPRADRSSRNFRGFRWAALRWPSGGPLLSRTRNSGAARCRRAHPRPASHI